jgi:hypothetical protein
VDVEKTIEFILEQQAQLVVRVQQLGDAQANLSGTVNQVILVVGQLAAAERNTQLQLRETQQQIQEQVRQTQQQIQELVAAQRRTDEKLQGVAENLDALIQVIQKLIHRDGRQS